MVDSVLVGYGAGVTTTLIGVGAKYFFDYKISHRQLQLSERSALSGVLGNSMGQLRKSIVRLEDRIDGVFRDDRAVTLWLRAASAPQEDGYFLSSFVYRLCAFLSWSAIFRDAIDALPPETVKERPDLRTIYERLDQAEACLTTALILDESERRTDREQTVLFAGTIDEIADFGYRLFRDNARTIPRAVFDEEYRRDRPPLASVRRWLALPDHPNKSGPGLILARLACLREVLADIDIGIRRGPATPDRFVNALEYADRHLVRELGLPTSVPGRLATLLNDGG
jgi:hypothetical protein